MNIKSITITMLTGVALLGASLSANAVNFSFTGNFVQDNSVQLFNFSVGASSPNVILETWSYAGGVNAAGQSIARGGFDPILAVFNSSGALIGQNDDGGSPARAIDLSGRAWDTYLSLGALAAGSYTVAVMQYDNFALGPNLANGFTYDAAGNATFTEGLTSHTTGMFWDVSGSAYNSRDNHWAFDILNVETAQTQGTPDGGSTMALFGMALTGLALVRNRLRK